MSVEQYLQGSAPYDMCDLFKAGAKDSWYRIQFSRMIPYLKIMETTITQNLIYEFKLLQVRHKIRGFTLREARNEKTNGADIELCIITGGRVIRYAVQAKIIYHPSKVNHHVGDYRKMQHTVRGSGIPQVDLLLDYGRRKKCIPLYLMYNYISRDLPFVTEMSLYGCTLISAKFLKDNYSTASGDLRKDVFFANIHTNPPTLSKPAFPWHELVCEQWAKNVPSILDKLSLDPKTEIAEMSVGELLDDPAWVEVTDGLDLTKRQQGVRSRAFERENAFSPKFQMIVDLRNEPG